MLLTRQKRVPPLPALNMTPMIDVVFQLLIFFMCTSGVKMIEQNLRATLPQLSATPSAAQEFEPVRIRVSRARGGVLILCDGQECLTFAALVAGLQARRAVADRPVIIEGESTVPLSAMVAAIDACYQADLARVAFSAGKVGR
jgi:biopolymer transport protein ExbD